MKWSENAYGFSPAEIREALKLVEKALGQEHEQAVFHNQACHSCGRGFALHQVGNKNCPNCSLRLPYNVVRVVNGEKTGEVIRHVEGQKAPGRLRAAQGDLKDPDPPDQTKEILKAVLHIAKMI